MQQIQKSHKRVSKVQILEIRQKNRPLFANMRPKKYFYAPGLDLESYFYGFGFRDSKLYWNPTKLKC